MDIIINIITIIGIEKLGHVNKFINRALSYYLIIESFFCFGGKKMKEVYFLIGFVATIATILVTENAIHQGNSNKKNQ